MTRHARPFRSLLAALGSLLVFALSLVLGVLVHLGTAPSRRLVARLVNSTLYPKFQGHIELEHIGKLSARGFDDLRVRVFDSAGREVLAIEGAGLKLAILELVRSVLSGHELRIHVREVHIARASVTAVQQPDGTFSLLEAVRSSAPSAGPPSTQPGLSWSLSIDQAALGYASVNARLQGRAPINAELSGLIASMTHNQRATRVRLKNAGIAATGVLPEPIGMRIQGQLALPSRGPEKISGSVHVSGAAGDVPIVIEGGIANDAIDARLDIPNAQPGAVRKLAPGIPVHAPLDIHLQARGTLPQLALTGELSLGTGKIAIEAHARTAPELTATATIRASNIDARALSPSAPSTRADAVAALQARSGKNGVVGGYALDTEPFRWGRERIPSVRLQGSFTQQSTSGALRIQEPGAPAAISYHLHPAPDRPKTKVVDFDARVEAPALQRVERLGRAVQGSASVHAQGSYELDSSRISADLEATASSLAAGSIGAHAASITATIDGPVSDPALHARMDASGVRVAGFAYDSAQLELGGSRRVLRVGAVLDSRDQPDVSMGAIVHAEKTLRISDANIGLFQNGRRLQAVADSIAIGDGAIDVPRIMITGAGAPAIASVHLSDQAKVIKLSAPDLKVGAVSRMLGQQSKVRAGRLGIDADLRVDRSGAHGYVIADVMDASVGEVPWAAAHVEGFFEGKKVRTEVNVAVEGIGSASIDADGTTRGELTALSAWRHATGIARIESQFDLKALSEWLPSLPAELAGTVQLQATAERKERGAAPDIVLHAETRDLQATGRVESAGLTEPPPGAEIAPKLPWRVRGMDVRLDGRVTGAGETRVRLRAGDRRGELARFEAHTRLPIEQLRADPGKARRLLPEVPVRASLYVPSRPILSIPVIGPRMGVNGVMALSAYFAGSMRSPALLISTAVGGVRIAQSRTSPLFDAGATLGYRDSHGTGHVWLSRGAHAALEAVSNVDLRGPVSKPTDWTGSAWAKLDRLPLGLVPQQTHDPVQGEVSGEVKVDELHRDARMRTELQVSNVRMGTVLFPKGTVSARIEDGAIQGNIDLQQSDGHMGMRVSAGSKWGRALAPSIDADKPIKVDLDAKSFRAKAALPFVRGTLSELDGRLNGTAQFAIDPKDRRATMKGDLALTEGVVEIPAIGSQYHDIRARLRIHPSGTVRLDDISARGVTGRLTASAQAKLA